MRAYSNSDTVGVHVTSSCNRRRGHCYQRNFTRDMNIDAVCRTLEGMEFANILLYGGEPLVRPFIVRSFMDRWPGRGFYLAANGTVPDWEIYDRVDGILLTVESFLPQRQPSFRDFGRGAFRTIMTVLDRYADKIRILHDVYPYGNDPAFYRMARLRGLDVAALYAYETHGRCNYCYKLIEEGCGPVADLCPPEILNQLSPVEMLYPPASFGREHAAQWREKCRRHNKRTSPCRDPYEHLYWSNNSHIRVCEKHEPERRFLLPE